MSVFRATARLVRVVSLIHVRQASISLTIVEEIPTISDSASCDKPSNLRLFLMFEASITRISVGFFCISSTGVLPVLGWVSYFDCLDDRLKLLPLLDEQWEALGFGRWHNSHLL